MGLNEKLENLNDIPVKEMKPKMKKVEPKTEAKIEPKVEIKEPKVEPKTQIVIKGQPDKKVEKIYSPDFEITEEMAYSTLQGIFETIHLLAPSQFNSPKEQSLRALQVPTHTVIKRWIPKVELLKYLPEIVLASGIIAMLKDMRKESKTEGKIE